MARAPRCAAGRRNAVRCRSLEHRGARTHLPPPVLRGRLVEERRGHGRARGRGRRAGPLRAAARDDGRGVAAFVIVAVRTKTDATTTDAVTDAMMRDDEVLTRKRRATARSIHCLRAMRGWPFHAVVKAPSPDDVA
jgi:hypothetical protein